MKVIISPDKESFGRGVILQTVCHNILSGHRKDSELDHTSYLLLMEHSHPVYTLGTESTAEDLTQTLDMPNRGIEVSYASRLGRGTYFSDGMFVAYSIRIIEGSQRRQHVIDLQDSVVELLNHYDIPGEPSTDLFHPGVWVKTDGELRKVAAIGVGFEVLPLKGNFLTKHGAVIYLNQMPPSDLRLCGEESTPMTTIAEILGQEVPMRDAMEKFALIYALKYEETPEISQTPTTLESAISTS
jgi:lipoate-protein ligase B